ncbi:ROK family transcriptional regulator [Amycolatopsis carbonis]|uniref:ROK family transcriptional regulator n=1 Tax=Amycolatopsis carbonis TaxID=715471 RepID=A0A9Y2N050_9PSEU|nr:ROK family transcriptional regulator [Amycolatopsis sp. 2-15]WIX81612.1 ROK family transcriptional regulator [Amycolatopsis sp. 2-15]
MTRVLRQTTRDLRRHNRAALLSSLYLRGPVSRLELVAESGLSPATVTNVVAELIGDGVVAEAGSVESDGGRPRTLLRVRPEYGQVVGVDVGETHVRAGLFDCALGTLATVQHPLAGSNPDPAEVVELARAGVASVLSSGGASRVLGVGVGVPGAVREGGIVHAPTLGWAGVAFADLLRAHPQFADAPLHLDNRARTLGQAEMWLGAGRGADRAVIALLGVGVGAAFVTDGGSFPGITTSEWGHTVVQAAGAACRCGSRGCLEAYVGTEAVVRRYGETPGAQPLPGADSESRLAELVALAEAETETSPAERSGPAAETLAATGEYLGIGIANLINLLAPDRVVLAGSAGAIMGPAILPYVRDAAARHALGYLAEATVVELGELGPEAVALGAATLPIAALLASGGRSAG